MESNEPKRKFKRVNVLGLDFYVDWLDVDNYCERIIAVKDVHGGRNFVYAGLAKDGVLVEDLLLEACGVKKKPAIEKKVEVAPAALETEQPKEELNDKKGKGRRKKVQE
jgi:hypothetical protein